MSMVDQQLIAQLHDALAAMRAERDELLAQRDHWIERLHAEQEKHTATDRDRDRWMGMAIRMEVERDAYVELAAAFLEDVTPLTIDAAIEEFKQCSMRPYNVQWYERYRRLVQALEGLPKVTA